ncbi:hypothetical protein [uncultured Pseudokineococcus sp.]|uniref:hypothetical protein n=1 Tax=uncultured Pseudokineococcus sp. TaxID=1642928 RepID=UPI0026362FDD|nr:hypothetical protein [uncultured Pseudokineococcus sp.]
MVARYTRFAKSRLSDSEKRELIEVDIRAGDLTRFLVEESDAIDKAHVFNAGSSLIQGIVGGLLRERMGFREEVVITPEDGLVTRARPDFFYSLGPGRGILAEVERGGTVNNNHDLKDVWKTHIAPDAHHLFLVVPQQNVSADGKGRERPFLRVSSRVGAFFGDKRREVDIVSAHIFGYGRLVTGARDNGDHADT